MPGSVFISHSSVQKVQAAELRDLYLPLFDLRGFVAHEDIEPLAKWVQEILSNLRSCDGMVLLSTGDAEHSFWVNQELGFALGRPIPIISIMLERAPWGLPGITRVMSGRR
jgi:hypothetical protein